MTDTSYIAGKTVVMTGKFSKMTRKEAQKAVADLGATIGKSVSGKVDLLIYGDKAGSKLQKAQQLGVETQNEDWLVALLAGEDPNAAGDVELEGPLSDYIERMDAFAHKLAFDPRIESAYYRPPGVSSATLARVAKDWGLEQLPQDISNFYQQANGLYLVWFPNQHEDWDRKLAYKIPRDRFPTSYDLENLPVHAGGVIWILPIEDALKKSGSYISYAYGSITGEREFWGGKFQGEEVERSLRTLDNGHFYYPVAFLTHPAFLNDFPVVMGDDYGAAWEDSVFSTFEGYMEDLLAGLGTPGVRRRLTRGYAHGAIAWSERMEPVDIETLIPATVATEQEDTFEVTIEGVEEVERTAFRGKAMNAYYSRTKSHSAKVAKLLDIDHEDAEPEELYAKIAEATESLKSIDMKTVKKLAPLVNSHKKTKTEVTEKLWCDIEESNQIVKLHIKTLYNATKQDKHRAEADARSVSLALAEKLGAKAIVYHLESRKGRKNKEAETTLYLEGVREIEVGSTHRFDLCPSGFVEQDGGYIWVS